jgi:high-affinity Fe2+/Pb2+ permease
MNNILTLNEAGSLLLGAGLVKVGTDVEIGLALVAVGAILKIAIAVLFKYGIVVSSNNQV